MEEIGEGTTQEQQPAAINTYDYAWITLSTLISLLWLRINRVPVFPLGLVGGLAISCMIYKIDKSLGKSNYFQLAIAFSAVASFLGFFFNG